MPFEGYDIVLGTQWLRSLGPIQWDFEKLQMKFAWGGKEVVLRGLTSSSQKISDIVPVTKITRGQKGVIVHIMHGEDVEDEKDFIPTPVQQLLQGYQELLNEPIGLLPRQIHDHRIPLLLERGPVAVRPYRYPYFQKNEIEKIVKDLIAAGIICPSTSPYSSSILLVKKHDGSWRMCVDYRALNQITVKDKFPILVIDELLDELAGAQFFYKIGFTLRLPSSQNAPRRCRENCISNT